MPLDVVQNYAEATVSTALNGTDPPGTSDSITTTALLGPWTGLAAGQQMRVMDKADINATSGYEILILTADNGGATGTWTVARGAEGSTVHTHAAGWTVVPALTAGGIANSRTPRLVTVTQSATPAIVTDSGDIFTITGVAQNITSMTTNLTGSPTDGQKIEIRFTDNGVGRSISWGASFVSTTVTLPSATTASTRLRVGLEWDSTAAAWACLATA